MLNDPDFFLWNFFASIGDAAFTLPIALVCAIWLWFTARRQAARWIVLLGIGMAAVGATKILYAGCGIEIPSLNFRVISGHTTLSTTVWTVAMALLCRCAGVRARYGVMLGLLIGVLTAVARVFDDAHSVTEVIAGWVVGGTLAVLFVRNFVHSGVRLVKPRYAALGLLLVASVAYGRHAPIQQMIEQYSPGVCAKFFPNLVDEMKQKL
ncbi:phosphatase PAP2 family protein [Paraburkholderia edwinii]|jgi:membrane-associated phospholipid phosphatase|uniref:Phosphatase PAP2 family protein n=1 Tax=Paraburkholderia edwinii TaxID=2861782 RepID=A0ABX8ULF7_9BURK|nr:phosphatase PAP2 family protein [Paraburkholderia edwinii]QYD67870.1 phosphatase PAP2 family protein [Paraburkholderia edwinii]